MRCARAALAAVCLLLGPAGFAGETAPETGLPAGVTPLPDGLRSRVGELLKETEKYRGLTAREPVPSGTVDEPVLKKKMIESFEKNLPPEKLRSIETGLEAFGLIPENLDLVKFFPELLTSQVAGYYDPDRHYLALVQREGQALAADLHDNAARRVDEAVLVHELTHALQDQYFHLESFSGSDPLDDADTAKLALIEGDATLVMMDFFVQTNLEQLPGIETSLEPVLGDPRERMGAASGVPGTADLSAAPAWFQDSLLFSYFEGFRFCLSARKLGGQALLDRAFTTDPPRSSEQVLHPEKWHTKRDDPVVIPWPDLARALPGRVQVSGGQLGELGVRALLRSALKNDERAERAAAGWGGDRFAVYEKGDDRLLVWITEWDTDADARELQSAARGLGPGWAVRRSGRRVIVTRGALGKAERTALGRL
jgi:hypothetical protein